MNFGIEGLLMWITEHYLLQAKLFEGKNKNQEQLEAVKEEVKNVEVVMATLNGLPGS